MEKMDRAILLFYSEVSTRGYILPVGGPAHDHKSRGREGGSNNGRSRVGTGGKDAALGQVSQKTNVWVLKHRCR